MGKKSRLKKERAAEGPVTKLSIDPVRCLGLGYWIAEVVLCGGLAPADAVGSAVTAAVTLVRLLQPEDACTDDPKAIQKLVLDLVRSCPAWDYDDLALRQGVTDVRNRAAEARLGEELRSDRVSGWLVDVLAEGGVLDGLSKKKTKT